MIWWIVLMVIIFFIFSHLLETYFFPVVWPFVDFFTMTFIFLFPSLYFYSKYKENNKINYKSLNTIINIIAIIIWIIAIVVTFEQYWIGVYDHILKIPDFF